MNNREVMQQALEVLEWASDLNQVAAEYKPMREAITALRAALAEPMQEPVAWMDIDSDGQRLAVRQWSDGNREEVPLYAAPPQRKPLAGPEQEPVAWQAVGGSIWAHKTREDDRPLYTAPPQRKPLTEEEIDRIDACIDEHTPLSEGKRLFARAIQRAHGIGEKMTEPMLRIWD